MWTQIKNFLNWPKDGIQNIEQLGTYLKTHWVSFVFLAIIVIIIFWIIKTIIGWLTSFFRSN